MKNNYLDISYKGIIKSKFTIKDVFTKIQNYLKKNKIDKMWICQQQEKSITINFNDVVSDNFVFDVNDKNKFSGYCRVGYDETIKETTLEKLLDMLFSIKSVFSKIEVNDDYSICESYLKSKEIKIQLLNLNEQDTAIVNKIYNEGYKEYREFLLSCIARGLNLETYKDLYINLNVLEYTGCKTIDEVYEQMILAIFETWLYETTIYKQKRFYDNEFNNINNKVEYHGLGSVAFDMYACCHGIQSIISNNNKKTKSFGIKDAQVQKLYKEKIIDMLNQQKNQYEQCIIAYRYLISIMKYTNFEFIGKDETRNYDKHCTNVKYSNMVVTIADALKNTLK